MPSQDLAALFPPILRFLFTRVPRWDGLMTFLLSDDVRARLLRQHFVFKVQPPVAQQPPPPISRWW